ncbi:MAG: aldehyde dehydrogenase family protein, partial [Pseudomonadota bacterium]
MSDVPSFFQNFINGAFVDGKGGRISIENPANGDIVAEQALADEHDVDDAVRSAQKAFEKNTLFAMRPVERGRMVRKIGDLLLDQKETIAKLLTLESGKPLWEAEIEVEGAARYFEYYGNQAETIEGRSIPLGDQYYNFTTYEPYGVSAQIIPWNYPLEMTARSLAAALATGNCCVIKTPEFDPLTNHYIAKAVLEAGFPDGSVNILCGLGAVAGHALSAHPKINQMVFTGSVKTGISIACEAARSIVPCVLELGGKSAAIVAKDADLDMIADNVRWGIFFNAGQVCSAMSRLLVDEHIYDDTLERICALANEISVGPGIERPRFGHNMGAMINEKQLQRAQHLIQG